MLIFATKTVINELMLIDFTIRNFMPYKNEVTFSMLASTTVKECESGDGCSNVSIIGKGKRVLRTAAIYGANGSGKSTVITAMNVFKTMVLRSFVDETLVKNLSQMCYHFDVDSMKQPVSMQMVFVCDGLRYRYGFEMFQGKVSTEWLYVLLKNSAKESYCFKRNGQDFKVNSKVMSRTKGIAAKTRDNALFLSTAAQFNVSTAMTVKEWFGKRFNVLSGLDDTLAYTARAFMHNPLARKQILSMIGIVDDCIKDVRVEENIEGVNPYELASNILARFGINMTTDMNQRVEKIEQHELQINAIHKLYDNGEEIGDKALNFKFESLGTTKLFALLGPFFDTIQNGGVLIIDEFGTSLHTQLSIELLKLFHSSVNVSGAQLVFTTHDTNLLRKDLLRRDQIWFTEKSREGISDLYSLVEYKINQANSVRNDASFSKDYLSGRYGAIPYFGNLEKFISQYGKREE